MQVQVLKQLDGIAERASSRGYERSLDVDRVAAMLREGEIPHSSPSKLWVILGIVAFIGLGVLCFGWYIYKTKRSPCGKGSQDPQEITTVMHKMNESKNKLQLHPDEAGSSGVEVDETKSKEELEMIPTVFVRHGLQLDEHRE
jgi:hypothetical protein